jgi:hypothetical protein
VSGAGDDIVDIVDGGDAAGDQGGRESEKGSGENGTVLRRVSAALCQSHRLKQSQSGKRKSAPAKQHFNFNFNFNF